MIINLPCRWLEFEAKATSSVCLYDLLTSKSNWFLFVSKCSTDKGLVKIYQCIGMAKNHAYTDKRHIAFEGGMKVYNK